MLRVLLVLIGLATSRSTALAQRANHGADAVALPFGIGERLSFVVSTSHLSKVGNAVMALDGPADVRGTPTLAASFTTRISVALMKASNESRSWIDPTRMASLRFTKREHRPFSSVNDSVEIFPALHHWVSTRGDSGIAQSNAPLDELSFIYFLRTAHFAPESTYSFDRHYDTRRSPTTVRVVKRETLHTRAGTFATVELEMRVKDGTSYKGEGVLHLWISEDRCRLPVRMESVMPMLGTGILTLESAVTPTCVGEERFVSDRSSSCPSELVPKRVLHLREQLIRAERRLASQCQRIARSQRVIVDDE